MSKKNHTYPFGLNNIHSIDQSTHLHALCEDLSNETQNMEHNITRYKRTGAEAGNIWCAYPFYDYWIVSQNKMQHTLLQTKLPRSITYDNHLIHNQLRQQTLPKFNQSAHIYTPSTTDDNSRTLMMCSCTHSGSLLPRMLSSSSSEMKKKRGKALRLLSR